jgi:hypothetical protein
MHDGVDNGNAGDAVRAIACLVIVAGAVLRSVDESAKMLCQYYLYTVIYVCDAQNGNSKQISCKGQFISHAPFLHNHATMVLQIS